MANVKRKAIPAKLRDEIFKKYDGHCAYCGKELNRGTWQVDHLIPVQRERFGKASQQEVERFENFMPSCRRCNHYKRAHSLETFRRYIEEIPRKLKEDNYIYKIGLDYGLVEEHPHKIVFYFEQVEYENNVDSIV